MTHTFTIQPTRTLHCRRVGNGWLVWVAGNPATLHNTYLHLHDDGTVERVTEGPDIIDVVRIVEKKDGEQHR